MAESLGLLVWQKLWDNFGLFSQFLVFVSCRTAVDEDEKMAE